MRNLLFLVALLPLLAFGQIEYTIQYDDGNTNYYSGRPLVGDTCLIWFEPQSNSQILSASFQFNDGMGGDADVFVAYLADDFAPDNYFDNDEPGWPGSCPSPIGEFLTYGGSIPFTFDDSGDWQEITFVDWGYPPEDFDVGTQPFVIGYELSGGAAQPYYPSILGDAQDIRPYHSLAYLTDPGGVYTGESGWWAYGIDWMIRVRMLRYGPEPDPYVAGICSYRKGL
jgi:hypothetical protein